MKTSTGLDVVVVDEGTVYQLQLERADCEKNLHNVIEGKDRVAVPPKRRHAKPLFWMEPVRVTWRATMWHMSIVRSWPACE